MTYIQAQWWPTESLGGAGERPQVGRRASRWEVKRSRPGGLCVTDILYLREQLSGNPGRAREPASRRAELEVGPRAPRVALGITRVCELDSRVSSLFQGLCSLFLCSLVAFSMDLFLPTFTLNSFVYPSRSIFHPSVPCSVPWGGTKTIKT